MQTLANVLTVKTSSRHLINNKTLMFHWCVQRVKTCKSNEAVHLIRCVTSGITDITNPIITTMIFLSQRHDNFTYRLILTPGLCYMSDKVSVSFQQPIKCLLKLYPG